MRSFIERIYRELKTHNLKLNLTQVVHSCKTTLDFHSFMHTPMDSFIHAYTHAFIHSCIHPSIDPCIHPCIDPCIHPCISLFPLFETFDVFGLPISFLFFVLMVIYRGPKQCFCLFFSLSYKENQSDMPSVTKKKQKVVVNGVKGE